MGWIARFAGLSSRSQKAAVAELLDCRAIEEVILRYGRAIDGRDLELMLSCFAHDATVEYGGRLTADGIGEIRKLWESGRASGLVDLEISTPMHLMRTIEIELDDEGADSRTYAIAHLLGRRGTEERVVVRGIQYVDRLERRREGWRIVKRVHQPLFMYEQAPTPL